MIARNEGRFSCLSLFLSLFPSVYHSFSFYFPLSITLSLFISPFLSLFLVLVIINRNWDFTVISAIPVTHTRSSLRCIYHAKNISRVRLNEKKVSSAAILHASQNHITLRYMDDVWFRAKSTVFVRLKEKLYSIITRHQEHVHLSFLLQCKKLFFLLIYYFATYIVCIGRNYLFHENLRF